MISYLSFQKKYKVETEVENWIQKYDSDMGERQVNTFDILVNFCLRNGRFTQVSMQ